MSARSEIKSASRTMFSALPLLYWSSAKAVMLVLSTIVAPAFLMVWTAALKAATTVLSGSIVGSITFRGIPIRLPRRAEKLHAAT